MNPAELCRRAAELADSATPFVAVTLVETTGSTPADAGAKMLVTAQGLEAGTVGGGRVEAKAISLAQDLMNQPSKCRLVDWSLKADVGMTCGGRVRLLFECIGAEPWSIVVFGAGHVAQALAELLTKLPCHATFVDPREQWLGRLPQGVQTVHCADPAEEVDKLPADAFVLCMTQGHRTDLPVLLRLYQEPHDWPYVGVIGSKAKAAVLRKELVEAGIARQRLQFHCPIGLSIGTNHPAEIAVSIAAQLLEQRDRVAPGAAEKSATSP